MSETTGSPPREGPLLSPDARAEGARRYAAVEARIAAAAARAHRSPAEIRIVAVAKKQPRERIIAAIAAGARTVGQSYIQEARAMRPEIEALLATDPELAAVPLEWRMVGRLQRNKAALAARLFEAVESIDRPELVDTLARRAEQEGRDLEVMIQISLCGEPQKGGCEASEVTALALRIAETSRLRLSGLMTVPAAHPDPEQARPAFRRAREIRDALVTEHPEWGPLGLSMGMSADLEVAVEEGATLVRVGTALFGERVVG